MKRNAYATLSLLLTFLIGASVPAPAEEGQAAVLLGRINRIRSEEGLAALAPSDPAAKAAREYAEDLASGAPFSHVDRSGNTADRRYRDAGGTGLAAGEILGRGPDPDSIFTVWLESPRHREVILGPDWTRAGAGIVKRDGKVYAAVTFVISLYTDLALEPGRGAPILSGGYFGKDPPVVSSKGKTMVPRIDTSGKFSLPLTDPGAIFVVELGYFDPETGQVIFTDMAVFDRDKGY
ncbi:MAG: CAP domain-containing protein [Spirochaetia bacterium]